MSANRKTVVLTLLKGLAFSIVTTLTGVILIALAAVLTDISDGLLTTLNQLLKAVSIIVGVCTCVGRGESRGFIRGAVLALIYMGAGYSICSALSGSTPQASVLLGEMLMGAAVGGICGAIRVNMNPGTGRRRSLR